MDDDSRRRYAATSTLDAPADPAEVAVEDARESVPRFCAAG
jgi:hypothetical protein